jgi:prolyl-tRNA synthetase
MEAAGSVVINTNDETEEPLNEVHTPGMKTIEDVCSFLKFPVEKSCKAVVYQTEVSGEYVALFLRGDLEANEIKIKNFLAEEIRPAVITAESGLSAGYLGPCGLGGNIRAIYDNSLKGAKNLCCGANKDEYHFTGLSMERDVPDAEFGDFTKAFDGGICPECGKPSLTVSRGIEVGQIFQLGTKYTKSMNMQYADQNGELKYPVMGCYGIGVGRLAASVCEAKHDDHGPIWPISIAPWHVHICCLRSDDPVVKAYADGLYEELRNAGIETIYDDRQVSAGVMFSDADILGVPVRVIASPRNMKEGVCEIATRDKSVKMTVKTGEAVESVKELIKKLQNRET